MSQVTVHVLQEDIDAGQIEQWSNRASTCPLARAWKREHGGGVYVRSDDVYVRYRGHRKHYNVSKAAQAFMYKADDHQALEPQVFRFKEVL